MPNEAATSNSTTNSSAWQQSSSTNSNNNTSTDTPPDTALLPVRKIHYFYCNRISFYSLKIGQVLLRQLLNHQQQLPMNRQYRMIIRQEHLNQIHLEHEKRKENKNGYHYL